MFHLHVSWHSKTGFQTKLNYPVSRTKEASILGHCLLLLSTTMQWITNKCLKVLKTILPNMIAQHRCSGVLGVYSVHKMVCLFSALKDSHRKSCSLCVCVQRTFRVWHDSWVNGNIFLKHEWNRKEQNSPAIEHRCQTSHMKAHGKALTILACPWASCSCE